MTPRPTLDPTLAAAAMVLAGRPPELEAVDLDALADLLEAKGLAGLAVAEARCADGSGAPDPEWPALEARLLPVYHRVALHTTLVLESANRALAVLAEAGIPALLFKGTALIRAGAYGDPGARPLEDADLLVPPQAAPGAVEALQRAGFAPWVPWDRARMDWLSSFSLTDQAAPPGVAVSLDVHWATPYGRLRLAGPWPLDPLWEGASPPLPAAEPHFVVLAEHLLKHLRVVAHARGVADLVRMAPRLSDADALLEQARKRRSLAGVRRVLAFLRDGLEVDLDPRLLRTAGVPERPRRRRGSLSLPGILGGWRRDRGEAPSGPLGDWLPMASPLDVLREVARVLAPTRRWLGSRYPDVEGASARRLRYFGDLARWVRGSGPSPLSPNQEFEA